MEIRMRLVPLDAAVAFRAGADWVVYDVGRQGSREWQIGELFVGRTGRAFRRLLAVAPGDVCGTFEQHTITYGAPPAGGVLRRHGDLLEAGGVAYALSVPPREIVVADRPRELAWQPGAAAFRAESRWFVYLLDTDEAGVDRRAILSLDGRTFHDLTDESFTGTGREHTWRFADPFHGSSGEVRRRGNEFVLDGVGFAPAPLPSELTRMLVPPARTSGDLFELPGGELLYASATPGPDHTFGWVRLWVGAAGKPMRVLPITRLLHESGAVVSSFDRRAQDHTTVIQSGDGALVMYWPDTYPGRGAELDGTSLIRRDLADYAVHEPALAPPTLTRR